MLGNINGCSWPVHRLIQKEYMSKYDLILDPKRCFTSVSDIGPGPKKKKYNSIYNGATDLSLSVADLQGVGLGLVNRWVEPLH